MRETINLSGLECDSCTKVVARLIEKSSCRLVSAGFDSGCIEVVDSDDGSISRLKEALLDAGYGVNGKPLQRGSLSRPLKFFSDVMSKAEYSVEREILEAGVASLVLMLALTALAFYLPALSAVRDYLPLLLLGAFGTMAAYLTLAHHRAFSVPSSCMTGMMVGMTIGMMGGFLAGALSGAANGMYIGSIAGMAVGMFFGVLAGIPVGVMGVLEGMMAGIMGGTMGAMLSVMLFNDHLIEFLVILFAACISVLFGLSYMLFRENGLAIGGRKPSLFRAIVANTLFFAVFSALLVWGPKTTFAWTGG